MKLPVSAFIICQDEEFFIERCIRSLRFCTEIIVVDSGSTDDTLLILRRLSAEGFPIQFCNQKWLGYGAQKQFALDLCTQDWCLSIDSDERVSEALCLQMPKLLRDATVNGWRLTRFPYLNGYGYAPPHAYERFHNRLFRRGTGRFDPTDKVHEGITIDGTVVKARPGGLLHFRPIPLEDLINKKNKYSSLKADMKRVRGKPAHPVKMLLSPPMFFFRWYFGNGLWRCGWPGFIEAVTGAIYSFLTEAKRYEYESMRRLPPTEPSDPKGY